jgi:hypothetical protein
MRTEQEVRTLIEQLEQVDFPVNNVEDARLRMMHKVLINMLHWVVGEEQTNG